MANTYTPNVQLAMPAVGDTGWAVPINGNCATLDSLAPVGALAVTTTEVPSASLNVHVAPGTYKAQSGAIVTFSGVAMQAVAASATNFLYLDLTNSGNVTFSNSAWPATAHVRLASVVCGPASIISITDERVAYNVLGSLLDGTSFSYGTVVGTLLGTAPNQKLGFYGHTPTVQPTMGSATAGSTYGANEQSMLQAVYNAVRSLGLGS